jgi:hypothetical protein
MAKPWMAASGVTQEQQRNGGPMPFVIGIVAMVLVALKTSMITTIQLLTSYRFNNAGESVV